MSKRKSRRLLQRLLDTDVHPTIKPADLRGSAMGPAMFELLCALADSLIVQPGSATGPEQLDIVVWPMHDHQSCMTKGHTKR